MVHLSDIILLLWMKNSRYLAEPSRAALVGPKPSRDRGLPQSTPEIHADASEPSRDVVVFPELPRDTIMLQRSGGSLQRAPEEWQLSQSAPEKCGSLQRALQRLGHFSRALQSKQTTTECYRDTRKSPESSGALPQLWSTPERSGVLRCF